MNSALVWLMKGQISTLSIATKVDQRKSYGIWVYKKVKNLNSQMRIRVCRNSKIERIGMMSRAGSGKLVEELLVQNIIKWVFDDDDDDDDDAYGLL
ncbi:hypothetical protein L1987_33443 [Smallanthus sonchifolius]|uniref:Uncharacterized protein n=1 Tax=Smallanthus sonchifolius TaxID=185202 RepID=A0ACB9HQJ1_9ASTR|nr:hypothetical protein L1987_33443 [Smallanthus sonchifolius]